MKPWTDEEVGRQFRGEVQQRFALENEAHLRCEREDVARAKAKLDAEGQPHPDWLVAHDSFHWMAYSDSEIRIDRNHVTVVTPQGFAIGGDFVDMFDETSVGWTAPSIGAVLVDGQARVAIDLLLIDEWDDERHAAWLKEHGADRRDGVARGSLDPTTAAIAAQVAERDRLRVKVGQLSAALATRAAHTTVAGAAIFVQGFDAGIKELHVHFATRGEVATVAAIEQTAHWVAAGKRGKLR